MIMKTAGGEIKLTKLSKKMKKLNADICKKKLNREKIKMDKFQTKKKCMVISFIRGKKSTRNQGSTHQGIKKRYQ